MSYEIDATPAGTVFSMSFGITEQTFGGATAQQTSKFDAVFKKGVDKGDTFFASSGDDGTTGTAKQHKNNADLRLRDRRDGQRRVRTSPPPAAPSCSTAGLGPAPATPRSWPTGLRTPRTSTTPHAWFRHNAVWNESWLPAATGGGPSVVYPRPTWQAGVLASAGDHRLVPDISVECCGQRRRARLHHRTTRTTSASGWHVYGGTSAASPQLAALISLAEQERSAAGKAPLGYIDPLIYANPLMVQRRGPSAFRAPPPVDSWSTTRSGNSTPTARVSPGPSRAGPRLGGYDMTTGLGTPWAPSYVTGLAAAP